MNGILGRPYRVFYTAKNIQSGLSGIVANVLRPDGYIVGPFNLLELANTNFSGIYYFDFLTTQLNPEGEYLITIKEGSYKSPLKVSFGLPSANDIVVDNQKIVGKLLTSQKLSGEISHGKISGRIGVNKVIAKISNSSILGNLVKVSQLNGILIENKITGKVLC